VPPGGAIGCIEMPEDATDGIEEWASDAWVRYYVAFFTQF